MGTAGHVIPSGLAERLFSVLFDDYDLLTMDGTTMAIPKDGSIPVFTWLDSQRDSASDRPGRQRGDRHRYHGDDPDRSADRLLPDPLPLAHQDVEKAEDNRLRHPVGLGPSQGHADRRSPAQPDAEHATPTATGRETRWPSTTSGAWKRRAATTP